MNQSFTRLHLRDHADGIAELCLDAADAPVNVLNQQTLTELEQAVAMLESRSDCRGLLLTSAKGSFVLGADITELLPIFAAGETAIREIGSRAQRLLNRIESLPFPSVAAIHGDALGGGFELALACDFRVLSQQAKVGLPEVKLGIMPGWGGSVRLPRLVGIDTAIEWMTGGSSIRAEQALKAAAADAVVPADALQQAALKTLQQAIDGDFDYLQQRRLKQQTVRLADVEQHMVFSSARGFVGARSGPHYPAPLAIIDSIQRQVNSPASEALEIECNDFARLASSPVAAILIGNFLNDQAVKRKARMLAKQSLPVKKAAVLGAGIMGGGIAYQSASKGVPMLMKDINEAALQAGLGEAAKLLGKQLERGRLDQRGALQTLGSIQTTLNYSDFSSVNLVVEAVVEKQSIKSQVLQEVEAALADDAILTSNTSTISINRLAQGLKRPENFCGMHFFNPVHLMPLVEVIRGEQSSDEAIATTVGYANAIGKTAIVVRDCPGFLVNRVLFPYMHSFNQLLAEGIDFQRIDKVMTRFGWPMGPAHLIDVVGLDTDHHAAAVMAEAYPDRMAPGASNPIEQLFLAGRLGQKNGSGFYRYELDKRGKPAKLVDKSSYEILKPAIANHTELSDEQIVQRMMLPLCLEAVRCLQEQIVDSAAELDMALLYGIGFPAFRGGALRYLDSIGLETALNWCKQFHSIGKAYEAPQLLLDMAKTHQCFYPQSHSTEAQA